jgi:hypothetical protein
MPWAGMMRAFGAGFVLRTNLVPGLRGETGGTQILFESDQGHPPFNLNLGYPSKTFRLMVQRLQ